MKIIFLFSLISFLISCKNELKEKLEEPQEMVVEIQENEELITSKNKKNEGDNFYQFKPDSISNVKINNVTIDYSYILDEHKIVVGYYTPINGELSKYDSKNNWGDRLLLLNNKDEIKYMGQGVGDVYLYQPYFYKNNRNNKIIIICHLAYEYFFGGDIFIFENGKIEYLGKIDIEGEYEKTTLIDILRMNENADKIFFTFESDSLTYKPGNEDLYIKNNNIRYEYYNKKLELLK